MNKPPRDERPQAPPEALADTYSALYETYGVKILEAAAEYARCQEGKGTMTYGLVYSSNARGWCAEVWHASGDIACQTELFVTEREAEEAAIAFISASNGGEPCRHVGPILML